MTYSMRISGKVQGVWYRASAKDKALSLGLKGRVWNEPNGDVGAIVQGDREAVDTFVVWCKEGPPLARVESVDISEISSDIIYPDFHISRHPET